MTTKERDKILEGAKEVFFAAMLDGYAGGKNHKSVKIVSNNGYTKKVAFGDPKNHRSYVVIDEWHTSPDSDYSAGTTLITFQGAPVWWMSYGGWYFKEAIPFLKRALRLTYEKCEFVGGRGLHYTDGYFEYCIKWEGDFRQFNGRESILSYCSNQALMGKHKFCGIALI